MPLTPKQKRFVSEHLVAFNASQAALRAGYSPRTALAGLTVVEGGVRRCDWRRHWSGCKRQPRPSSTSRATMVVVSRDEAMPKRHVLRAKRTAEGPQ